MDITELAECYRSSPRKRMPYGVQEKAVVWEICIARFDPDIVRDACEVNRPTAIAVHGLDYLGFENQGKQHFGELNEKAQEFLLDLRKLTGVPIKFGFTGRSNSDVIVDVESEIGSVKSKVRWRLKEAA